eukprot:m.77286 g.77286  ORF g.77286 m.77286 type:complete len:58 (-) comp24997_c0_seq2:178-351(-)
MCVCVCECEREFECDVECESTAKHALPPLPSLPTTPTLQLMIWDVATSKRGDVFGLN